MVLSAMGMGVLCLILGVTLFFHYAQWAWAFDLKNVTAMPATSVIYDRNGYVVQRLFEENRILVTKEQIPKQLKQAVIAAEDQRFYWHFGFDPLGILRAVLDNWSSSRVRSGASSITQQLARNSANMFERTLDRKLKELFLAVRLELAFSKDEILTLYLNRIFFGRDVYGIGAAAQSYFGKTPQELNLSECAMLAGIISGPNSFSPWHNPNRAKMARARVLDRMVQEGYIKRKVAEACKKEALVLSPLMDLPASHAVSTIWDEWPKNLPRDLALKGGLRIYSTVDVSFQRAAEQALDSALEDIENNRYYRHPTRKEFLKRNADTTPNYLQGAFVAIHNADGGILAIVGSRNYQESPFNRAVTARRQVGSTLKPFVYAHLFQTLSATPFTEVNSAPFDLHFPDQAFASDGGDYVSARDALEKSDNYCAVRSALAGGVEGFAALVQEATGEEVQAYPSSALGACELSLLGLTRAYTIFPNDGILIKPHIIQRIESRDGVALYEHQDQKLRLLWPGVGFQIHTMLEGVVERGTAQRLRGEFELTGEIAGKTGTTDDFKDCWFLGYTTEVTAGVWIGLDLPQPIIGAGYSSRIALPVWANVMKLANEHYVPQKFSPPANVQLVKTSQRKKMFFFFDADVTSDQTEYIRHDQIGHSLVRVEDPATLVDHPEYWQQSFISYPDGAPLAMPAKVEDLNSTIEPF